MRLVEMNLTGFRSITGTTSLRIRPQLTCLIGANEHGKSNLLDALGLMNKGKFAKYDKSVGAAQANELQIRYRLQMNPAERKRLLDTVKTALSGPEPDDDVGKKNRRFLESIYAHYSSGEKDAVEVQIKSDSSRSVIVPGVVSSLLPAGNPPEQFPLVRWARSALPQVRLFPAQDDLADSISLEQLNERSNLAFEGLLKLANVWTNREDLFEDSVEGRRLLEQAGKTLTKKIRKIWSQAAGHTYRFDQTDGNLHLSIKDPITFDTPSRRSLGYRSFFSFYLSLFAETEEIAPEGYILLFDEPGIHLHPQGQKDLLAEIRRLAKKNQIVYTTHSPFMIDRNDPANTVLVYKGSTSSDRGTRINYKPWGANWTPLSGALGITAADAFFLPERPLVVEGTSDKLYVAEYMRLMQGQTGADLNYLTMIDGDRREDVEALLRILLGTDRRFVVLIDSDPGGQDWAKRLQKLAGEHKGAVTVVEIGTFADKAKPMSIEDLLPPDDWFAALQRYVTDVLKVEHVVDRPTIERQAATLTLGRAAAEYLVSEGVLKKPRDLSKTGVAHLLLQANVSPPPLSSPLGKLCTELTRLLELNR